MQYFIESTHLHAYLDFKKGLRFILPEIKACKLKDNPLFNNKYVVLEFLSLCYLLDYFVK